MLLKAELTKSRNRIRGEDLLRSAVGKKRNRDRDQAAYQMRVAVAGVVQDFSAFRACRRFAFQPNLADAAPHFVDVVVGLLAQGLKRMTQFEDIAIPILPIVERGEIVAYGVDR